MNGRVKRKIREIKGSFIKSLENERISLLQWETLASKIANTINDLPLAFGNITSQFENMDLLTPNWLHLGRNNDRSPIGSMMVTNNPDKFLFTNKKLFNTWFEFWLISYAPKLIHHPKWFQTERDVKIGDVVLFLKKENHLSSTYQYGMISDLSRSSDEKSRKATVRYWNSTKAVDRFTNPAVWQLIVIHPADELNMMEELGQIPTFADMQYKLTIWSKNIFGLCWSSVKLLTITPELYTKMFRDQKLQVSSCVSNWKNEFFYLYVWSSSSIFVQVLPKTFCLVKLQKS